MKVNVVSDLTGQIMFGFSKNRIKIGLPKTIKNRFAISKNRIF